MVVRLHGIQIMDFVSQKGEQIKGTNLFICFAEDGVVGEKADKIFLKDGFALPPVKPGDMIDIDFNNKGKAVGVTIATKQV